MKIIMLALLGLSGCASKQIPFQKADTGFGYSVETKGVGNFLVKTNLPSELEQKSVEQYTARAVGEECLQQGFQYFDFTSPTKGVAEGFCFKENKRKALAVTFEAAGLIAIPPSFAVENLNQKSKTNLLVGDKLVKADDRVITSVSELKSLAFQHEQKGIASMNLEVLRQGKILKFTEPLADMVNGAHDFETLESLRKRYY